MGSFDGANTWDLVGLYMLLELTEPFGTSIGLYRDDGLAVLRAINKDVEDSKKKLCAIFRKHGLEITVEANKKVVNFLDVTFNLRAGTYEPYMKPGNTPLYVHRLSNHPPSITKNIPDAINRRLSSISSNEEIFRKAAPPYQEALINSGYDYPLHYEHPSRPSTTRPRNRQRKIHWYNPPFSTNVESNIGRKFLKIVADSFPRGHKLAKIFNRNTIKLSYSCMPSMGSIINRHNKSKLNNPPPEENTADGCNCRVPAECPVPGRCLTSCVIYQATVTTGDNHEGETYVGVTADSFKKRYSNHLLTFNHRNKRNFTELSKYVWALKDRDIIPIIKWKFIASGIPYSNISKRCGLCLEEKYIIRFHPEKGSLNKRDEVVATCRHKRKFLVGAAK